MNLFNSKQKLSEVEILHNTFQTHLNHQTEKDLIEGCFNATLYMVCKKESKSNKLKKGEQIELYLLNKNNEYFVNLFSNINYAKKILKEFKGEIVLIKLIDVMIMIINTTDIDGFVINHYNNPINY